MIAITKTKKEIFKDPRSENGLNLQFDFGLTRRYSSRQDCTVT
jgi:hypothetical protein